MSEQALTVKNNLPITSMNDLVAVGQLLSGTRLFGCQNPSEGFVIAAICHQEGWTYAHFTQTYHFIGGKIAKRSDAIQAAFQQAGGSLKILKRDGDGAIIKLKFGETEYESKCVWEEIKDEAYTKEKDRKTYKDNYSTPRRRMQMMWARAISDGVRTVYPAACQGTYTPEEVSDFDGADAERVETPVDPSEAQSRAARVKKGAVKESMKTATTVDATVSAPPYGSTTNANAEQSQVIVQPQTSATSAQQEPMTPFNYAERVACDFSLCPIEGAAYRLPWDTMTTDNLKLALTLGPPQYPAMDNPGYKQFVNELIQQREGGNK